MTRWCWTVAPREQAERLFAIFDREEVKVRPMRKGCIFFPDDRPPLLGGMLFRDKAEADLWCSWTSNRSWEVYGVVVDEDSILVYQEHLYLRYPTPIYRQEEISNGIEVTAELSPFYHRKRRDDAHPDGGTKPGRPVEAG